jgi:hypothetical protein
MRDDEVPQDANITLGGHSKAVYAKGADGRIHIVASTGWEVEEIVTRQAVLECDRLAEEARQEVLTGAASPLKFHMCKARMDVPLLSQTSGLWQWRVRRHLRPEIYAGLSQTLKTRYADAMGLTVAQLDKVD